MKKNNMFVIKEIAGNYIIVPFGEKALDFNGLLTVNDTARFLWEKCEGVFTEKELELALVKEYNIDEKTANEAVDLFLKDMKEAGCIE